MRLHSIFVSWAHPYVVVPHFASVPNLVASIKREKLQLSCGGDGTYHKKKEMQLGKLRLTEDVSNYENMAEVSCNIFNLLV